MDQKESGLALSREKRANAGAKMSQMLDAEEDEFYKSTYGGFIEEAEDNDYSTEDSDSDAVDSDFSIDENDEVVSEDENEDNKKVRRAAYREPKTVKPKAKIERKLRPVRQPKVEIQEDFGGDSDDSQSLSSRKSLRPSTKRRAEETEMRAKIAKQESDARKKQTKKSEYRQLTQAELLREAKKTEELNLKSLERYRKLELEKSRKSKIVKQGIKGPIIRYNSVSMPLIEEIDDNDNETTKEKNCSRNFISFSDEETFKTFFKQSKPPVAKQRAMCPISHLPARFFDPVTKLPFSNSHTFRAIRTAYYKQLEQLGDMKQPEVAKWVTWWRSRNVQQKQAPRILQIIK